MCLRAGILLCVLLAAADTESWVTCDYRRGDYRHPNYNVRCGDQCIDWKRDCQCGNETFRPGYTDQHCCLPPGGNYTREPGKDKWGNPTTNAVCTQGRTHPMSSLCVNTIAALTCYNSYQDSDDNIGPQAHFTCPHTCVPWENMCRGVSWCQGDYEVCGSDLTCPGKYYENGKYRGRVTKPNINSSAGSAHHYCLGKGQINNRQYDSIDRDDEKNVTTQGSALDIDITPFTQCTAITPQYHNIPGVMCDDRPGPDYCKWSGYWCNEAYAYPCDTGSELI